MQYVSTLAIGFGILFLVGCGGGGDDGGAPTMPSASFVVGQPGFTVNEVNRGLPTAVKNGFGNAGGVSVNGSYTLVADTFQHRVLGFNGAIQANDPDADFVIGQPDFTTRAAGVAANRLDQVRSALLHGSGVLVCDTGNHRVLIWTTVPKADEGADYVVGQTNFTSGTEGVGSSKLRLPNAALVVGGRLLVADSGNHRVLIWNAVPTANGVPADVVVGQSNFLFNVAQTTASGMNWPNALWSDGTRLFVSERVNNRILVWNTIPTTNGAAADLVLGQDDFTTNDANAGPAGFHSPTGIASDGTRLFVSESGNSRILIFDPIPTTSGAAAVGVIGQSDFVHTQHNDDDQNGSDDGSPTARTLYHPNRIDFYGGRLFVPEFHNHRVTIFEP